MISETIIHDLKATSLVDVIRQYVKLKRSGSQYVGLCPFHAERTPSFSVHPHKGYNCFGCGEHGSNAIDFLMAIQKIDFREAVERLAAMTGVNIDDNVSDYKPTISKIKPIQRKEPERVDYIPNGKLKDNLAAIEQNNLYKFLLTIFDKGVVADVCRKYNIGSSKYLGSGTTLFAQRDINGNFRQAKVIYYKPDGHRDKNIKPLIIGKQITKLDNLQQCFFGEHLIPDNDLPIAIVESEKTAAICSIVYPQYLWLATGGKSGCNMVRPDVNKALRGRRLYLFPDVDGVADWQEAKEDLEKQGFTVQLVDLSNGYESMKGTKYDIADLVISNLKSEPDYPESWNDCTPDFSDKWQLINHLVNKGKSLEAATRFANNDPVRQLISAGFDQIEVCN